ncbi:hypothetical protein [Hyalangium rubrum]|uniref:Arrestin-like N-terminal domain-containing protein n=1 Tax=Hyalangium rubrum TaxID=3103134 RepID=A0ABU5H775_9BACT|nr:hypothetical protein [Hyalangium sp. s54d21]MDY7229185.1 hypothetical protein [Hyalangium sp. s54d21]
MNLICTVQFDEAEVEAGGLLTGRVCLLEDTSALREARKMRLSAICRVEGPGKPEVRVLNTAELPGPFKPQVDLPFRIPIPEKGPITYQGIILQIRWHLDVQLVVPEGFSPRKETSFDVVPASAARSRRGPPRAHPKAPPA